MDPIIIAVIVVLCQYPVAVVSLIKMFRCKWDKTPTFIWNFVIVLLPFVGAASFWIYYLVNRKKIEEKRAVKEREEKEAAVKRAAELDTKDDVSDTENVDTDTDNNDKAD